MSFAEIVNKHLLQEAPQDKALAYAKLKSILNANKAQKDAETQHKLNVSLIRPINNQDYQLFLNQLLNLNTSDPVLNKLINDFKTSTYDYAKQDFYQKFCRFLNSSNYEQHIFDLYNNNNDLYNAKKNDISLQLADFYNEHPEFFELEADPNPTVSTNEVEFDPRRIYHVILPVEINNKKEADEYVFDKYPVDKFNTEILQYGFNNNGRLVAQIKKLKNYHLYLNQKIIKI